MLNCADYRAGWETKLAWYRNNGVLPVDEGEGAAGVLLVTTEAKDWFDVVAVN